MRSYLIPLSVSFPVIEGTKYSRLIMKEFSLLTDPCCGDQHCKFILTPLAWHRFFTPRTVFGVPIGRLYPLIIDIKKDEDIIARHEEDLMHKDHQTNCHHMSNWFFK